VSLGSDLRRLAAMLVWYMVGSWLGHGGASFSLR